MKQVAVLAAIASGVMTAFCIVNHDWPPAIFFGIITLVFLRLEREVKG